MTRTFHMCVDIEGMLRNNPGRKLGGLITDDDGMSLSWFDAQKFLHGQLAMGRKVLPMGKCEGFDYKTGCPGHPETESSGNDGIEVHQAEVVVSPTSGGEIVSE